MIREFINLGDKDIYIAGMEIVSSEEQYIDLYNKEDDLILSLFLDHRHTKFSLCLLLPPNNKIIVKAIYDFDINFGHDGGLRLVELIDNSPKNKEKSCNCGAKHTSTPDFHYSWCDSHPVSHQSLPENTNL